jgi:hypothetical protein
LSEPSPLDAQREVLERVSQAVMPNLRVRPDDLPMGTPLTAWKIEQLESHLLDTAILRQEATRAKLIVQEALDVLQREWDEIEGWEVELRTDGRRSQADVLDAKRRTRPDLYSSIQTAKRLIDRLSEQVRRLEKDDNVTSRIYTLMTGG